MSPRARRTGEIATKNEYDIDGLNQFRTRSKGSDATAITTIHTIKKTFTNPSRPPHRRSAQPSIEKCTIFLTTMPISAMARRQTRKMIRNAMMESAVSEKRRNLRYVAPWR